MVSMEISNYCPKRYYGYVHTQLTVLMLYAYDKAYAEKENINIYGLGTECLVMSLTFKF